MQDAVWGALFCQTMMDRFLTLLGDPQRCNNLFHFKKKHARVVKTSLKVDPPNQVELKMIIQGKQWGSPVC